MKKLLSLFLALLLLTAFAACGSDRSAGRVLTYDIPSGVTNLDPQFATDETARMIISNTFEGLFRQLSTGEVVNCLAKSYEVSPDGLTYTFRLRTDSRWSNTHPFSEKKRVAGYPGDPVTSHDFAFALRRMFDSTAFSPFANEFSALKNAARVLSGELGRMALGISTPDDATLVLTLDRPDNLLPQRLSASYAMPCNQEFFELTAARYGLSLDTLIFNGPFRVAAWDNQSVISLRRNQNYQSPEPAVAGGVNLQITPPESHAARFLAGDTDAGKISFADLQRAQREGASYEAFEDTVWVVVFNLRRASLANPDARRALSYAVDRSLFADYPPGNLTPTAMLIPPVVSAMGHRFRDFAGSMSPILPSPEIAKRYYQAALASLGVSRLPFNELLVCDENDLPLLAGFVQQGWQNHLGISTGLAALPRAEVLKRVEEGDFQAAVIPITASYSSPDAILSGFRTGSPRNYALYEDARFDALLDSTSTMDSDAQYTAYAQAEQQLLEECVVIPLFFETSYYAMGEGVDGVAFSPFLSGVYFKDARKE